MGTAAAILDQPNEAADDDAFADPVDPTLRRCVATMESLPLEQTIRFIIGPDGQVLPDLGRKLPGRGLHVTASRVLVERAVAKRNFARAARRPVQVDAGLADLVERLLAARVLEALGLARRAGQAVAGHDKVAEMARRGGLALLVQAADGSRDEKAKLAKLAPRVVDGPLSGSELGQIFARDRAVHVGIGRGRLAGQIETDLLRLAGFRVAAGDDGR